MAQGNEAPRPEAEVSGRPPPRGPVTSGCPRWGRSSQKPPSATPSKGPLHQRRGLSHDSRTLSHQGRRAFTEEGTPDRWKLFGSHGQRPWLQDVVRGEVRKVKVDRVLGSVLPDDLAAGAAAQGEPDAWRDRVLDEGDPAVA